MKSCNSEKRIKKATYFKYKAIFYNMFNEAKIPDYLGVF